MIDPVHQGDERADTELLQAEDARLDRAEGPDPVRHLHTKLLNLAGAGRAVEVTEYRPLLRTTLEGLGRMREDKDGKNEVDDDRMKIRTIMEMRSREEDV